MRSREIGRLASGHFRNGRCSQSCPAEDSPTMQQEKIEFPKFTVPGQTNWVKWVLVGVGGLVVISAFTFGVALSKRNQASTEVAAAPAKVDVPLAPSATPRPVPQPNKALAAAAAAPADIAT